MTAGLEQVQMASYTSALIETKNQFNKDQRPARTSANSGPLCMSTARLIIVMDKMNVSDAGAMPRTMSAK